MSTLALIFSVLILGIQFAIDEFIQNVKAKKTIKLAALILGVFILIQQYYESDNEQKNLQQANSNIQIKLDSLKYDNISQKNITDSVLSETINLKDRYDSLVSANNILLTQNIQMISEILNLKNRTDEGFLSTLYYLSVISSSSGSRIIPKEAEVTFRKLFCAKSGKVIIYRGFDQEQQSLFKQLKVWFIACGWKVGEGQVMQYPEIQGIKISINSVDSIPHGANEIYWFFKALKMEVNVSIDKGLPVDVVKVDIGYL